MPRAVQSSEDSSQIRSLDDGINKQQAICSQNGPIMKHKNTSNLAETTHKCTSNLSEFTHKTQAAVRIGPEFTIKGGLLVFLTS